MNINCNQCGEKIIASAKFCPFCGELAPQKTIIFSEKKDAIENPKYCPNCKTINIQEALFCQDCGEKIHKRPENSNLFCGECGEKNPVNARICCGCGQDLDDWFAMKGKIALKLGYQGDVIFTEKMNGISYRFLSKNKISIGRRPENDIVIPCIWVSANHCSFTLNDQNFTDTSTNGTFINRKPQHIKKEKIDCVNEFNLADAFTFYTVKRKNIFGFRLGAIQNEKECRQNGDGVAFDKLREVYTILYWGNFELIIQKLDGYISDNIRAGISYYKLKYENGFYYYSDKDKNIDNLLLLKNCSNFPKNWKIDGNL